MEGMSGERELGGSKGPPPPPLTKPSTKGPPLPKYCHRWKF